MENLAGDHRIAARSIAGQPPTRRTKLPFRAVNRRDGPAHVPGMQRHHLVPRQLLARAGFTPLFDTIGRERLGFDDFRCNGLLLPSCDTAAVRVGLPLHRGPHRAYNEMVCERLGQIEADWAALRGKAPEIALDQALMRIGLLQRALRRRLLAERRRLKLNRHDPLGRGFDFAELDAMADALWAGTSVPLLPAPGPPAASAWPPMAQAPAPGTRGSARPALAPFPALRMACTLAVATSSSMPTPQPERPSGSAHSM